MFVEMFEMEIVQQMARSGKRLVDVRYLALYSLGKKITTCIIAHRLGRCASRCAIIGLYSLDSVDAPVDVR